MQKFEYVGFFTGTITHNFDSIKKNENGVPKWFVLVEPNSFNSARKVNGFIESDGTNPRKFDFHVNEYKKVCLSNSMSTYVEDFNKMPIPRYLCDFLRRLADIEKDALLIGQIV